MLFYHNLKHHHTCGVAEGAYVWTHCRQKFGMVIVPSLPNACPQSTASSSSLKQPHPTKFYRNPAEIMSSSQPGPSPGNASLDLKTLRKQLDEDYGKAYDLVEVDTLAFLSSIESI